MPDELKSSDGTGRRISDEADEYVEDRETALFVYDLYRKCRFHELPGDSEWLKVLQRSAAIPEDRPIARRLSIDPVEQPVDESKKWLNFRVCIGSVLVSAFVVWSGHFEKSCYETVGLDEGIIILCDTNHSDCLCSKQDNRDAED